MDQRSARNLEIWQNWDVYHGIHHIGSSLLPSGLVKILDPNFPPMTKVTSFIVVNNNTRIVSNTESGPYGHFGKGETMATVTLFVRALPGNVYPSVMDALSEKMVELFPQKTVQLHFEIFNVLPPMFDGVGFYYMSVLLNVDISKD